MTEQISPQILATRRRMLSQEYQNDLKELGEIQKKKAFKIIELRATVSSDKQAERLWAVTDDGQKELELIYKSKGLIELIRCAKTEIDILNNEAFGTY